MDYFVKEILIVSYIDVLFIFNEILIFIGGGGVIYMFKIYL